MMIVTILKRLHIRFIVNPCLEQASPFFLETIPTFDTPLKDHTCIFEHAILEL